MPTSARSGPAHLERMRPALQRARSGDQDERPVIAERQLADCDVAGLGHRPRSKLLPSLLFHDAPRNATPARASVRNLRRRERKAGSNLGAEDERGRSSGAVIEPGFGRQRLLRATGSQEGPGVIFFAFQTSDVILGVLLKRFHTKWTAAKVENGSVTLQLLGQLW